MVFRNTCKTNSEIASEGGELEYVNVLDTS